MKTYFGLLIWLFFMLTGIHLGAQNYNQGLGKLSPELKTAFHRKYPVSTDENWVKTEDAVLISFRSGDDYLDAYFDDSGKWLKTEISILPDQLPVAVQDSLKTGEFRSWQKGSAYKVEFPGKEIYKVYVYSSDWNEMELNFDKTGRRII